MNGKLAGWLQLGANVGILAGLIMVALQMQQNEDLLRLQLTNQFHESYIAADSAAAGENMYLILQKAIEDPDGLSYGEMRALESQTSSPLNRWVGLYRLAEEGLLDSSLWRNQVDLDAPFYFGTEYGRAWWEISREVMSDDVIPGELKARVDERLAEFGHEGFTRYYDRIRQRVRDNRSPPQ